MNSLAVETTSPRTSRPPFLNSRRQSSASAAWSSTISRRRGLAGNFGLSETFSAIEPRSVGLRGFKSSRRRRLVHHQPEHPQLLHDLPELLEVHRLLDIGVHP